MCNKDIKQLLKSKGIYQWQLVAKALNITTSVFFTELDFLIDKDGNIQTYEIEEHLKAPFKIWNNK